MLNLNELLANVANGNVTDVNEINNALAQLQRAKSEISAKKRLEFCTVDFQDTTLKVTFEIDIAKVTPQLSRGEKMEIYYATGLTNLNIKDKDGKDLQFSLQLARYVNEKKRK